MMRVRAVALTLALALTARVAVAQQSGMPRAFELERRGDYAGAAAVYRTVLAGHPAGLLQVGEGVVNFRFHFAPRRASECR